MIVTIIIIINVFIITNIIVIYYYHSDCLYHLHYNYSHGRDDYHCHFHYQYRRAFTWNPKDVMSSPIILSLEYFCNRGGGIASRVARDTFGQQRRNIEDSDVENYLS